MAEPMNLYAGVPEFLSRELIEPLPTAGGVRIERIVSLGHSSAPGFWYDQDHPEWVALLQGAARLRFEGDNQTVDLKPGDYLDIPAHRRHRVEWTDPTTPTIWLAVHYQGSAPTPP
jgi:cupin 2 domain-containing protein